MRQPFTRTVLGLSGLMALGIGGFILFDPHTFFSQNTIVLDDNPNLLSEIRAPGGLLLAAGLVIFSGALIQNLMRAAQLTAVIVFGMYGLSRAISIVLDGMPSTSLVGAMIIELLIAATIALILRRSTSRVRELKKGGADAY